MLAFNWFSPVPFNRDFIALDTTAMGSPKLHSSTSLKTFNTLVVQYYQNMVQVGTTVVLVKSTISCP